MNCLYRLLDIKWMYSYERLDFYSGHKKFQEQLMEPYFLEKTVVSRITGNSFVML